MKNCHYRHVICWSIFLCFLVSTFYMKSAWLLHTCGWGRHWVKDSELNSGGTRNRWVRHPSATLTLKSFAVPFPSLKACDSVLLCAPGYPEEAGHPTFRASHLQSRKARDYFIRFSQRFTYEHDTHKLRSLITLHCPVVTLLYFPFPEYTEIKENLKDWMLMTSIC